MSLPANTQKWASAALGILSLLLLVNLVMRLRAPNAHSHAAIRAAAQAATTRAAAQSADDLARYDPILHEDVLKALNARPLPGTERDLFDFAGGAPAPARAVAQQQQAAAAAPAPAAPPPPPPMLLKPEGYNEMPGGEKQAFVSYGSPPNDQTTVVREGDVVMARYKILKITPGMITVEDSTTHQTADLPIPQ